MKDPDWREFEDLRKKEKIQNCVSFYRTSIGTVEVCKKNELTKIYFAKPFLSHYLTDNIRYHLIYQANRNSDQERIEHLFFNVERYRREMLHRQYLSRFRVKNKKTLIKLIVLLLKSVEANSIYFLF